MASAAAPTYFPAHHIGSLGRRFVDGGLFANAPDLAALTLARRRWPEIGLESIHIVSIGTTTASARSPYGRDHPGAQGILSWVTRPAARILKVTMRAQVDHALAVFGRDRARIAKTEREGIELAVIGGAKADWFQSAEGNQVITGGGGGDDFLFRWESGMNGGRDTIHGFSVAEGDRIGFNLVEGDPLRTTAVEKAGHTIYTSVEIATGQVVHVLDVDAVGLPPPIQYDLV